MEDVKVVPECSQELKPFIGQCFKSLDFANAFYDIYARAVGFDTRKQGIKKVDGVTTWQYVVCSRQGKKRSDESDMVNACQGFSMKRRRLSNRCGCEAKISFRYFSENGIPGYKIQDFLETHNHAMVEVQHKQFMSLNRKLDEVHEKFILDCSKANIGPTMTFKFLKEVLGGYETVGCTVGDVRNASRDIKSYAHGCDVQMVLDEMRRKKDLSESFTYHYEVSSSNQLEALFWCDGQSKRNYHMFGDVVAFDSTYNTNRYCMISSPFTGKDNHGKPVTFAAGLVSNEKTGAFAWLFRHFVQCMGVAPKMIVTNQDKGMRSAIQEILVGTRHRWCMWHIMYKLASKVPKKLLRDENFKKEFHACVWSDLHEPEQFEELWKGIIDQYGLEDVEWFNTMYGYREYWIPAYFRDFPLGSMIRTTSVYESENSFYKNFLKPRSNLAEFYLSFNNALDCQHNSIAKLDYADSTKLPILATVQPFENHASTLYTDSMFRRVQEEIVEACCKCRVVGLSAEDMRDLYKVDDSYQNTYVVTHDKNEQSYSCESKLFGRQGFLCSHIFFVMKNTDAKVIPSKYTESRWLKTSVVRAVHGYMPDSLQHISAVDDKQILSNELTAIFYGCLGRYQCNTDRLRDFAKGMKDLCNNLESGTTPTFASDKRSMVEEFYGMSRPELVEVHPPDVVKTKGSCSSKGSRLISQREKAIREFNKPLRKCATCQELGHHDSRNCARVKAKEKENAKGKEKC